MSEIDNTKCGNVSLRVKISNINISGTCHEITHWWWYRLILCKTHSINHQRVYGKINKGSSRCTCELGRHSCKIHVVLSLVECTDSCMHYCFHRLLTRSTWPFAQLLYCFHHCWCFCIYHTSHNVNSYKYETITWPARTYFNFYMNII